MKTFLKSFKYVSFVFMTIILCYACNNDENNEKNGSSPFSNSLGIKITVMDKDGNEITPSIPTIMPGIDQYWHDDTSKGLNPEDYSLEIYMDNEFLYDMTNPREQTDWPIVKESGTNAYPWWGITLPAFRAGEMMLTENTTNNAHTIEYHMQFETLFKDKETHIIRFDYKPFGVNTQGLGYYADVYFDGKKVETYYPESYKVNASTKGIKLDIEEKYWIEGAIGWPIAIIYL